MLVLGRRTGEKIRIGDNVIVTVVRSVGKRIQIGIQAPKDVSILREELVSDFGVPITEDKSDDAELKPLPV